MPCFENGVERVCARAGVEMLCARASDAQQATTIDRLPRIEPTRISRSSLQRGDAAHGRSRINLVEFRSSW